MTLRDDVLSEVERFIEAQGMGPSTFGRLAVGDPNFVRDLRRGKRRIWPETADKARVFIREYDPAKLDRPAGQSQAHAA